MPIRLCQKCGLKVLIDESQAGTNPFYCQRCTTAMKGQENAPARGPIAPVKNPTPSPVSPSARSSESPSPPGAAKSATVRVLCPYCKASFNGRVPLKPARGSCPVCQKELILLPNGDIKPAAGFDLTSWQGDSPGADKAAEPTLEPEPAPAEPPKESGTRLLVKKYAAEPSAAAKLEAPPPRSAPRKSETPAAASADSDPSDGPAALPGWLDDSGGGSPPVKPQPETDMNIDVVEPKKIDDEDRTIKVPDPPPPPPAHRARAPVVAKMPTVSPGRPPSAVAPPPTPPPEPSEPEVELLPPEPPPKRPAGRVPSGERRMPAPPPAPVAVASSGEETSQGKVFLALILALLPVVAGAALLSSQDKLKSNDLVKKVGARFVVGFAKVDQKLFPPPPPPKPKMEEKAPEPEPPPKEEPPKPDPDQQKKDELAISTLYTQIIREQRDLKSNLVGAAADEKERLQSTVGKGIEAKRDKLKMLQETYKKMYGKDYDPANQ